MAPTRWVRVARSGEATRSDGVFLSLRSGAWVLWRAGEKKSEALRLKTPGLAAYLRRAIEEVDEATPPPGWTFSAGLWSSGVWCVRPVEGGWGVFRTLQGKESRASRQVFESADRGRWWAELRFERGEAGLRGPKPRAGSKATYKLPDVRVTEEERQFAENVVEQMQVSYSEFARAALYWVQANVLDARTWAIVRGPDGVRFEQKSEVA